MHPKLEALAKFPELAHYHKSAEKYAEDDGYSHPGYVRVIGSGSFTLMQNRQWGNNEYPATVVGVAVVGGWAHGNAVPIHHTDTNRALFGENWPSGNERASIITKDTLRGWRDAAPYREAARVRKAREQQREERRNASARKAATDYARAEELARGLTVKHGVTFTAESGSFGPRVVLSLAEAEKMWGGA